MINQHDVEHYLPSLNPEAVGSFLEECCIQDDLCDYTGGVVLPKASNAK